MREYTRGVRGHGPPRNLASPKRTFRTFSERINEKMNEKLR